MTEERKHHSYSPSSLQNLEACPCYVGRNETKLNERCVAGTRAHGVIEKGVDDARLSDEDAAAAADCLDFIEHRRQIMSRTGIPTEHKEIYLKVDDEVFEDSYRGPELVKSTTAGYVDHVLLSADQTYAELFDYKFGLWPVEDAENNLQGIAYSLGLFRAYPTIQQIHFWFKQPHLDHVSDTVFTREQIPTLYLRVQTVVARARQARHAGDFFTARPMAPVCNFCANLGVCPKVAEIALQVGKKYYPLAIPDDITPTMIHEAKDAGAGKRLAQVVKNWADSYSRELADRVIRGEAPLPEGYRIETRSNRVIADKDKFREITLKHLTEDEYYATFDPSFTPIEDLIKEKAPRGAKKSILESYQDELMTSGAVTRDIPYTFLKAVAKREINETKNETKHAS